jgi:hypothetical protein
MAAGSIGPIRALARNPSEALRETLKRIGNGQLYARLKRARKAVLLWQARRRLVPKPYDPRFIDALVEPEFRASMAEAANLTQCDTAQLVNLWQLCRAAPTGALIEIGTYRGGSALHISNARPLARMFVCDTFEGFAPLPLDPELDDREYQWRHTHGSGPWEDTNAEAVRALFTTRGRDANIIKGRFPMSDTEGVVRDIAFAHVDVTIYDSCHNALEYLKDRSVPNAIWLVDSYRRTTKGIDRAVDDFIEQHQGWRAAPIYPGEAIVLGP